MSRPSSAARTQWVNDGPSVLEVVVTWRVTDDTSAEAVLRRCQAWANGALGLAGLQPSHVQTSCHQERRPLVQRWQRS